MSKKLYITGVEKRSGKSFVSLTLLSLLQESTPNLIAHKLFKEENNGQRELIKHLAPHTTPALMTISKAIEMMHSHPDDLLALVLEKTKKNPTQLDYFEGSDFESDNDVFEFQFNLTLSYQLNCDTLLVVSAKDRTLKHTLTVINNALEIAKSFHTRIMGLVVNRANLNEFNEHTFKHHPLVKNLSFVAIIPEFESLANPRVLSIAQLLKAEILCGHSQLQRLVKQFTIAAKTVGNFLESRIDRSGMLIITPDDRIDILLGSLLADQSVNYPKIAGIVLTNGEQPGEVIQSILDGLDTPFPVLLTSLNTYETATTLHNAKFNLTLDDLTRVSDAIEATRPYLVAPLKSINETDNDATTISPAQFLFELVTRAKAGNQHIVLPEGEDIRVLKAAHHLLERQIVRITLLGNPEKILTLAKKYDLDISCATLVDINTAEKKEHYAELYCQLRQHKNINLIIAEERMTDVNYFAAMMVYCNDADGMVSGAMHTTADTVRPALEIIKTKPGINKVSSVFIMCMPSRVLIYGDCAINPEPDSELLAEIAINAADIAARLGLTPKVALLSYSSGASGKGESVTKVANALTIIQNKQPELTVEGPIQYDAAVDSDVALKKLPHSLLKGLANVLIFPDLNTGNNTYKAVQRETGALAIGPVLLGLNKPVNDLSRGCTPEDIINTILITAIQAQETVK